MGQSIRVNFHSHSTCSDGSMTPQRVAEAMADAGVQAAALTDHNTTEGLAPFAEALGRRGVAFITGAEITACDEPVLLHLLAYGFDPENPELQDLLRERRRPAAPPLEPAQIIGVIHRAGGTAFLAHPHTLGDQLDGRMAELRAAGLDGIEAIYEPYPEAMREKLIALARRHGLLVSAGSDFHGYDRAGLNRLCIDMPMEPWVAFREANRLPDLPAPAEKHTSPVGMIRRRIIQHPVVQWRRFSLRIIFPTLLAVGLFVLALFAFILPAFERNLLDRKREMIRELTNSAWSILAESEAESRSGVIARDEAQKRAISRIESLRYGKERKDYFWLTDMQPLMLMHPYRKDLNGTDLRGFVDVRGRKLFVEFAKVAQEKGEGYVEYYWQWKDNPDRVAPKQSFVKRFEPWGWVIGTGIYLDDVHDEIASFTSRLTWFSVGISAIVVLLLAFMTRESLSIERQRGRAEAELRESHEKYAALVEAATEGTLMVLDGRCAYANKTLCDMLGYSEQELSRMGIRDLFDAGGEGEPAVSMLEAMNEGRPAPASFEATMLGSGGRRIDVVLTPTRIAFAGKTGFIVAARDLTTRHGRADAERDTLLEELQTALLFLNEPLRNSARELASCDLQTPVRQAAELMTRRGRAALAVTSGPDAQVVGILTDRDLRERIIGTGADSSSPVAQVMSAPVAALPGTAAVFEAILTMQERGIHHLAVRGEDGRIIGIVRNTDLVQFHQYSSAVITSQIQRAESVGQIIAARERFPRLVKTLLDCGARPRNIARITSRLTDAIVDRLLELAAKQLGPAPCRYCFVALGSEGRGEQTLVTDQDNAIIYEDLEGEAATQAGAWFLKLGELVCAWLDQAGYALCTGKMMASNPRWCRPLSAWRQHFAAWISAANPNDLLEFSTFFDMRGVSGDRQLTADLRRFIHGAIADNPPFLLHFARNALLYKPPIGLFGQLVGEAGEGSQMISLKEASLTMVHFARLYALRHRLDETNTLDRLQKLNVLGVLKKPFYDEVIDAYSYILQMRLNRQAQLLADNQPADNLIDPKALNHMEQTMLKQAFGVVSSLRKKISYDFFGMSSPIG